MKLCEKSPVKKLFEGLSDKLSLKVEIRGNVYDESIDTST